MKVVTTTTVTTIASTALATVTWIGQYNSICSSIVVVVVIVANGFDDFGTNESLIGPGNGIDFVTPTHEFRLFVTQDVVSDKYRQRLLRIIRTRET